MRFWTAALAVLTLTACATLPPGVPLDPRLGGTWSYVGGAPLDDPLLDWSQWPDLVVTIDAVRGHWAVQGRPGARSVLPPGARVVQVDGTVLTLVPEGRSGEPFQVYYRFTDGRLEFWWGDHPDWLKPRVTYERR
jgi:hypothetical protein